jgi:hypothetical protein
VRNTACGISTRALSPTPHHIQPLQTTLLLLMHCGMYCSAGNHGRPESPRHFADGRTLRAQLQLPLTIRGATPAGPAACADSAIVAALLMRRAAGGQAGSLMQLLRDLAAEGVIALAGDAGGAAPHGVGGFEVLDREAFQRCARRPRWGGDCEDGGGAQSMGGHL